MSKRNEAVRVENGKHGSLDADASARLDALLEAAGRGGFDVDASAMMVSRDSVLSRLVVWPGAGDPGRDPGRHQRSPQGSVKAPTSSLGVQGGTGRSASMVRR